MKKDIYVLLKGIRFKVFEEVYLISEDMNQVIFNGYYYRWDGCYYRSAATKYNKASSVHRAIWIYYNGDIPKGYEIHHIDKNPKNNDLSNLQLLSRSEHGKLHSNASDSWPKSEKCKAFLRSMNDKAKLWHSTPEGIEWHKNHAKTSLPALKGIKYKKICDICQLEYIGKQAWQKYCSNACKTKNRVIAKLDFIDRACCICQTIFNCNKYAIKKTCSLICALISQKQTKESKRI